MLHDIDIYETYNSNYMSKDLSHFLTSDNQTIDFAGKYPCDFLVDQAPDHLPVWHLVGGLDPLEESDRQGNEPDDAYPVTLREWIQRDGLTCLKIKLRGTDAEWDYDRLTRIGDMANELGVTSLSADFNCTVTDPAYVNSILDRLKQERPDILDAILYVEQPFPYDLENNQIDVTSVSERKPLFLDESAHDWKFVQLGRKLGWTGVALKTCKTQTVLAEPLLGEGTLNLYGAGFDQPSWPRFLMCGWQPMLGRSWGEPRNAVLSRSVTAGREWHPGIFVVPRNAGSVHDQRPGFGYRVSEVDRNLPEAESI